MSGIRKITHSKSVTRELLLASGGSNPQLAKEIANYLSTRLADIEIGRFSDGETRLNIKEHLRGKDFYIIQSLCGPVNENIMDLLIMTDAAKRASARRVIAVIPYYGYARQDKKMQPREPITAKLVADLLEKSGVRRIMTMDLHAASIQGFFNIPVDHLTAMPVFVTKLKELGYYGEDVMFVSPDVGGVVRTRTMAQKLDAPISILYKRRPRPNVAEMAELIGNVEGMRCVMVDDMADTAGTLCKGAEMLMKRGAKEVISVATHGILSGDAVDRIEASPLSKVLITDTVPMKENVKACEKIHQITVADFFGEAIIRNFTERSISELFI